MERGGKPHDVFFSAKMHSVGKNVDRNQLQTRKSIKNRLAMNEMLVSMEKHMIFSGW